MDRPENILDLNLIQNLCLVMSAQNYLHETDFQNYTKEKHYQNFYLNIEHHYIQKLVLSTPNPQKAVIATLVKTEKY